MGINWDPHDGHLWNGEAGKRWLGEVLVMGRNMGRGKEEEGHLETTAEIRMVDRYDTQGTDTGKHESLWKKERLAS